MTNAPGDLTRQWVNLFKRFPQQYRQDEEIARWIAERRVGPLTALLAADQEEAREELHGLRRRYPNQFARAQGEYRGEYEWDEFDGAEDHELTERQSEKLEQRRDREEAEYEWVNEQYRTYVSVLQNRTRLIDRIRELEALEGADTP